MSTRNRLITTFLLLLLSISTFAQIRRIKYGGYDDPHLAIIPLDISKFSTLDTAFIKITYRVTDTLISNKESDITVLLIGHNVSKYYSESIHQKDSLYTAQNFKPLLVSAPVAPGYEVFKFLSSMKILVTNRLPYTNQIVSYEDVLSDLKWKLLPEKSDILGYSCQKAVTTFRGRNYLAWFTTELPNMNGPWKLGGLPGLILFAEDASKQYTFECIGIKEAKEPIVQYQWKMQTTSLTKWKKFEKNLYEHAGIYLKNNNIYVLKKNENGTTGRTGENWHAPYDPLER